MKNSLLLLIIIFSITLIGCDKDDETSPVPAIPLAETHPPIFSSESESVTSFVAKTNVTVDNLSLIDKVSYTINTKTDNFAKPVKATYTKEYFQNNDLYDSTKLEISLPIIGLYHGYANTVDVDVKFTDGSVSSTTIIITTSTYSDSNSIYDNIDFKKRKTASEVLGYDYFYIKSAVTNVSPVVMDSDGEVRWVAYATLLSNRSSIFDDTKFIIGSQNTNQIIHLDLLGNEKSYTIEEGLNFHHNIEKGKIGFLIEPDRNIVGDSTIESIIYEVDEFGIKIKEWDMGKILSAVIEADGEDPSNFVRNSTDINVAGKDWFHVNSAYYSSADNSLLISSRENFVMKIDYDSSELIWLFGDKNKHWYVNYPSLQKYSIDLNGGNYPIGQHALSISKDGSLLLFNDGYRSTQNPTGTPAGLDLTYSAPIAYTIDDNAKSASVSWTFENNQTIYSDICSSVYQASDGSHLIAYSVAYNRTKAKIVGIDKSDNIVFDFEMPTNVCNSAWNADIINFENLIFE